MSLTFMIGLMFLTMGSGARAATLDGCLDPAELGQKLKELRATWDRVTPEQLVHKWDVPLAAEQCETNRGQCLMFVARRRVIRGVNDCSEAFVFSAPTNHSSVLTDVVIRYAAPLQSDIATAARQIVDAIKPPAKSGPSINTLQTDPAALEHAAYQWSEAKFIWVLTLETAQSEAKWHLHVNITRHAD